MQNTTLCTPAGQYNDNAPSHLSFDVEGNAALSLLTKPVLQLELWFSSQLPVSVYLSWIIFIFGEFPSSPILAGQQKINDICQSFALWALTVWFPPLIFPKRCPRIWKQDILHSAHHSAFLTLLVVFILIMFWEKSRQQFLQLHGLMQHLQTKCVWGGGRNVLSKMHFAKETLSEVRQYKHPPKIECLWCV